MTTLHIHLLGQLRLFWNERPYPFKALPKVTPILSYLLLNQDTATVRDTLAFKLWPDATEKQAKARLRRHLYDLRRALPSAGAAQPWLLITAQTVQWNPAASYWLDVAAFEHLSQQPSRLAEAMALYTGALLPDVDETWLLPPRQRLRTVYQQVLSQLIIQSWQAQDYRQALHYCEQVLAEDAFNEEIVRQKLALHYAVGDRGTAVAHYHHFSQQLDQELEVEPLPETTAVHTAIQQNRPTEQVFNLANFPSHHTPHSPTTSNIPTPLRPLIGRQSEQQQIIQLLTNKAPTRLLTLTGTGGIGKTRLAIALGQALVEKHSHHFPDGVFFVSLAPLREGAQVITAVAETLALTAITNPLEAVREHLRYQQCLLILDNFEHLLPAISQLHDLLQTAPQLQLLVTSRTPLNLYGEQEYPIPALELPNFPISQFPEAQRPDLQSIESIAFFTAVARTVNPRFELNEENETAVARLCQQLDGLPLAIELAASRNKHFPPDVLLQQLTKNLNVLQSQAQDVPERHRTLEAALQWSFDLLSDAEKQLLIGLSLFEDGFAVTAVSFTLLNKPFTDISDIDPETITLLTSLADKNLIRPAIQQRIEGELRFTMLNVIRAFIIQKLSASDKERLMQQLLRYFAQWDSAISQTHGTDQTAIWTQRFQIEYKNLSAALNYASRSGTVTLEVAKNIGIITTFSVHWLGSGHLHAVQPLINLALAHSEQLPLDLRYRINLSAGTIASERGDFVTAKSHLLMAQTVAQQTQNLSDLIICLQRLNGLYLNLAEFEKALTVIREAYELMENSDTDIDSHRRYQSSVYGSLGITYLLLDEYAEAERFLLLQLEKERKRGYLRDIGGALANLGTIALNQNDFVKAGAYLRESLSILLQARSYYNMNVCISIIASLAYNLAHYERCVILHSATIAWDQQHGIVLPEGDEQERQDELAQCHDKLGEQVYQIAWRNGRNLTLEQAATLALQEQK